METTQYSALQQVEWQNDKRWFGSVGKWLFILAISAAAIVGLILAGIAFNAENNDQITSLNLIPDPPPTKFVTFERTDAKHQILETHIKKEEESSGLLLTSTGNAYFLANTGVYSIEAGTGVLIDDTSVHVPKISIDPHFVGNCSCGNQTSSGNVTLSSVGSGQSLVDNGAGPDLTIKSIVGTNGITVTSNSTTISIEGAGFSNTSSECFTIGLASTFLSTLPLEWQVISGWTATNTLNLSYTGTLFNNVIIGSLDVNTSKFTVGVTGIYAIMTVTLGNTPPSYRINGDNTKLYPIINSFGDIFISLNAGDYIETVVFDSGGTVTGPSIGNFPYPDFYQNTWGMCLQGGSGSGSSSSTLSSAGGDVSLVAVGTGANLETKGLVEGNGITITENTTAVEISLSNLIVYTPIINITATALQSGGQVVIQPSSGISQYRVITAYGIVITDVFGGIGDRKILITDGVNDYGTIRSFSLTNPNSAIAYNGNGDSTGIDLPFNNILSIPTSPGASIYVTYTGGTFDYTGGSLFFSMVLMKIA